MEIKIEWFQGKYDSFNVSLHSKADSEAFLVIKSCSLMNRKDGSGEFVAFPTKKLDNGKYWNHVFASKSFNDAVLKVALASRPRNPVIKVNREASYDRGSAVDMADDLPF